MTFGHTFSIIPGDTCVDFPWQVLLDKMGLIRWSRLCFSNAFS